MMKLQVLVVRQFYNTFVTFVRPYFAFMWFVKNEQPTQDLCQCHASLNTKEATLALTAMF